MADDRCSICGRLLNGPAYFHAEETINKFTGRPMVRLFYRSCKFCFEELTEFRKVLRDARTECKKQGG